MNVFLGMVGCRLNQSELEIIAHQFRSAGHHIVSDPENADLAIVNTCTVTAPAAADSRKLIRRIARAGCERIYPTGCLATIDPHQVGLLPSVVKIYPNAEKENIAAEILISDENQIRDVTRVPLPGKLKRTRAFIKVQDGCDNFCTFCVTRIARGKSRSRDLKEILSDVQFALDGGVKEIVLTGVNLGSWGRDLDQSQRLSDLIEEIIEKKEPLRIRLSSLEPWDVDQRLLRVISHPSVCSHLHLPLQSGSDRTLERMSRRITTKKFRAVVDQLRKEKDRIAITTDIIVGFPGETTIDFQESRDFIKDIHFSGGHVFRFSPRPGTPAEKMTPMVLEKIKKSRSEQMRTLVKESQFDYMNRFKDQTLDVLWEKSKKNESGFQLSGIADNYIIVNLQSDEDLYNQISKVKVLSVTDSQVLGEIIL